jgi:hypothetical protein
VTSRAKGTVIGPISPSRKALATIRRRRKLSVALRFTYTPSGGTALTRSKTIVLRLSR